MFKLDSKHVSATKQLVKINFKSNFALGFKKSASHKHANHYKKALLLGLGLCVLSITCLKCITSLE